MKKSYRLLIPFALITSLSAETVVLKSGKKIVGEVKELPGDKYEIKSKKNGVISFTTVKKSDVYEITREDVENKLFKELMELKDTPDLMKHKWYLEQKEERIDAFLKEFPRSKFRSDIEALGKALMEEAAVIKDGGIKINGDVVSAKERAARSYDIDSQIALSEFKEFLEKRQFGAAIAIADKMELDFPRSKAFGEVVQTLPALGAKFQRYLELAEDEYKRYVAQEEKAKTIIQGDKLKAWMALRKRQFDEAAAREEAEKKAGEKWPAINPFDLESIKERMDQLEDYRKTIEKKVTNFVDLDVGANFTKAWRLIEKKEFELAKPILDKLESQKMNFAYYGKLEEFYYEEFERQEEEELRKLRGVELDIIDLYMNVDEKVQETIYEAIDAIEGAEDEEAAKSARGSLKMFTSRVKRKLKEREGFEKMDPRDMETQNSEFAQAVEPLIEKYNASMEKAMETSKYLDVIREAMVEFQEVLPTPDDFLTENAKRLIAEFEAKQREVLVAETTKGKVAYIKNNAFVNEDISKKPDYYILYFSASW